MLETSANHALGRRILQFELCGQIGARSYFRRRWPVPSSHAPTAL
jgi:hypothetical protein